MSSLMMTNSDHEICLTLTPVMDLAMAVELRLSLIDCLTANKTIKIIGSDVERITTPCLQVLYAMKKKTMDYNIEFLLTEISEPFQKILKNVGLLDQFSYPEQKA
ncbi:MAG: STAS domain-containing protein [Emcibacter sp.]|nr:STAS domain-containing protein [Emcibacter sp.]